MITIEDNNAPYGPEQFSSDPYRRWTRGACSSLYFREIRSDSLSSTPCQHLRDSFAQASGPQSVPLLL